MGLAFIVLWGCRDEKHSISLAAGGPRIVSFSPAITKALEDLGLGSSIVGCTRFCDLEGVLVVGDLYDVDHERLVQIHPTHVLIQPPSTGADPGLLALAKEHGWIVGQWRLDTVEDVLAMISGIQELMPDPDGSIKRTAGELGLRIQESLKPISAFNGCGRILLVENVDPVLVFGRNTYLSEVLETLGGTNAVNIDGYPELNLEDIVRINPDAVVFVSARATGRPIRDLLGPIGTLEISAVQRQRLALLACPDALMPSSGIPEVVAAFREVATKLESPH